MLKDGWKSVGKVFVLALILDVVYQIIVMRFVYPGEALITAVLLAIVPYLTLRGLVTRFRRKAQQVGCATALANRTNILIGGCWVKGAGAPSRPRIHRSE